MWERAAGGGGGGGGGEETERVRGRELEEERQLNVSIIIWQWWIQTGFHIILWSVETPKLAGLKITSALWSGSDFREWNPLSGYRPKKTAAKVV